MKMEVVVMVLDWMYLRNFHCEMINGVKMLFLELVIVPTFMVIVEKLGEGRTDRSDDTAIAAEAKYSVNIMKLRKKILH